MTDRVKGFTVTLDHDIRIDDVQPLLEAIKLMRGVAHVEPSLVTMEDHMNRQVIKMELAEKLYKALNEK